MKRYLLATIILMSVNVNASSNPFELQENLQKIDKDHAALLSTLKDVEKNRVAKEMLTVKKTTADVSEEKKEESSDVATQLADTGEETAIVNPIAETKVSSEVKKQQELAKQKDKKAKLALEQANIQKAEEERIQKVKEEQVKIEQARAKQAMEKSVSAVAVPKEKEDEIVIVDINISRENQIASQKADKDYSAAIKEMDED